MQLRAFLALGISTLCVCATFGSAPSPARADEVPPHMKIIAGYPAATKAAIAQQNVTALDLAMFGYYDEALAFYKSNILAQHPVIMALFSGAGGKFILYRPGKEPLTAEPVPMSYQLLKSVAHSTMALFEVTGPHLDNPADQSWVAMLQIDRAQQQAALRTLGDVDVKPEWRDVMASVLTKNIAFMDASLSKGVVTYAALHALAREQAPPLERMVKWGARTQVDHWMEVVAGWKTLLGSDWDKTYGLSNSIYVTRQNNVLFSVLAQFFGADAMNTRLVLFETTDFTTTPDDMLTALTRVIADRSVGQEFFGNYYMMDYELMGGDGRDAIAAADKQMGVPVYLPPLVPFGSHEWPGKIVPGDGPGTIEQLPQLP